MIDDEYKKYSRMQYIKKCMKHFGKIFAKTVGLSIP